MNNNEWWRGAVFYQIYPRSFMDTNDDGVGDLKGITDKLDYVAALGVDGIWISPFFKSPMKDFGYDVSDYRDVDPLFGTLNDFDTLLKKAHSLNLKVIVDLVLSHTSDQHPWFKDESKKNWYVWADAKPDMFGETCPPNNWASVFGGSAWEWSEERQQYYLHNFLKEQPDLNYHNPEVQNEALDICRFWLERGVDGFRLDVINFLFHDRELRDNPPRDPDLGAATQLEKEDDPYNMQQHIYDKSRPENLEFLRRLRKLMDEYPGTMTLGEIGDDHPFERAAEYTAGNEFLNTAYNTHLMAGTNKALSANFIREPFEEFLKQPGNSWPSWAFSNHDVVRAPSRWNTEEKSLIALLCSLRGTTFIYQGEELGLPEAKIPFEKLQDPWGKYHWPDWPGRDGCRTPMPWDDSDYAGFTNIEPWLPIPEDHKNLSVQNQENDESSALSFTRKLLQWRKTQPDLIHGDIKFMDTGDNDILAFKRNTTLCVFNLSDQEKTVSLDGKNITLGAYEHSIDGIP